MNRINSINTVWDNILEFNNTYFPNWKNTEEVYYSNALAGEVGEVCNNTKHRSNGGTKIKAVSDVELLEELADCFIYMELIIEKHGYNITDFSNAIQDKINKNKARMEGRIKEYDGLKWIEGTP